MAYPVSPMTPLTVFPHVVHLIQSAYTAGPEPQQLPVRHHKLCVLLLSVLQKLGVFVWPHFVAPQLVQFVASSRTEGLLTAGGGRSQRSSQPRGPYAS